jgi:hypothetical protein
MERPPGRSIKLKALQLAPLKKNEAAVVKTASAGSLYL